MLFVSGDLVLLAVAELGEPVFDHVDGRRLVFLTLHSVRQNKPLAVGRDVVLDPTGIRCDQIGSWNKGGGENEKLGVVVTLAAMSVSPST